LKTELTQTKTAIQKAKKRSRHIQSISVQENDRNIFRQRELQRKIASLLSENEKLESMLDEAGKRQEDLNDEITKLNAFYDGKLQVVMESRESELRALEEQFERERSHFVKVLAGKEVEFTRLSQIVTQHEKSMGEAHRAIASLRETITVKEEQLAQLVFEKDARVREIEQIKEEHNDAVERITARVRELQILATKYENTLSESETRYQTLSEKAGELQVQNEELCKRVDFYKDGRSRDQQLSDARLQALALSVGTQKQIEFDNLRAHYDEEHRKLAAFVANSLPQCVDLRCELNEEGIRETIFKAASELARYEKQDAAIRRLLGISKSESCESVIAHRCSKQILETE
jgi:chromosome segregation ATPase